MKLKILADAASEFYSLPDLRVRQKPESYKATRARHICQWMACDAGYKSTAVAKFWGMERSAIYYGCRAVEDLMAIDPNGVQELKELMELVRERLTKTRQLPSARKASS